VIEGFYDVERAEEDEETPQGWKVPGAKGWGLQKRT
jgi:hypothetical protein